MENDQNLSSGEIEVAENLVMNGLLSLQTADNGILRDKKSVNILQTAYNRVTSREDRDIFEQTCLELQSISEGETTKPDPIFENITKRVLNELDKMDIKVTVDHRTHIEFSKRSVWLYNLIQSEGEVNIAWPDSVQQNENKLSEGIEAIRNNEWEIANDKFQSIHSRLDSSDTAFIGAVELLLGWTSFWVGNKKKAANHADTVLKRCDNCWEAKLLWIAATHNRKIEKDVFDISVLLQWMINTPSDSSTTVQVSSNGCEKNWEKVSSYSDYDSFVLLDRIHTNQGIRFILEGPIQEIPEVSGYYLGLGTVDHKQRTIREVERVFQTGPITKNTIEKIYFRY